MKNNYTKKMTADGFISATPLPSDLELQNFYAETYYQSPKSSTYQESYDSLEIDYKNLKCNVLLHALKSLNSTKEKSFLDIGATLLTINLILCFFDHSNINSCRSNKLIIFLNYFLHI